MTPLISICHRCPHSESNQPGFKGGACACTADPQRRQIRVMVKGEECPKGYFSGVDAPKARPTTAGKIIHGAAGVAKALIGIDRASPELIKQREAICVGCDKAVMVAGVFRKCSICGCATALKMMNAGEKCPEGRW